MVVACLFAGVGAWGAAGINVDAADHVTYAAELFGTGAENETIQYPAAATGGGTDNPTVSITYDQAFPAPTDGDPAATEALNPGLSANAAVEIMFTLSNARFGETVQSSDLSATGWVGGISIADGGAVGDSSVTFTLATGDSAANAGTLFPATGENVVTLTVPRLTGITALNDPTKQVGVTARLRITQGSQTPAVSTSTPPVDTVDFPDGKLGSANVVYSANVVTLMEAGTMRKGEDSTRIDIDKREMLRANSFTPPFTDGASIHAYRPRTFLLGGDGGWAAQLAFFNLMVRSEVDGEVIRQWNGTRVDSDVAGVLDIDVTGAIREGDMVFANLGDNPSWWSPWVGTTDNRTMDGGESLTVTEGMAMFTDGGFSIDPGDTDEDEPTATETIGVYYVPNGKDPVAHGATIHLSAIVNYTKATSKDEDAKTTMAELRYHGVDDEVKAYAIPFDGNGKGDKANVRIRCETGDLFTGACRPFLECWDDMGMRSFGESDMIAANALDVLNSMDVEMVVGAADATTRHSCRVLSTGRTSVQQLTRDGTSGTLVNNTYVGE